MGDSKVGTAILLQRLDDSLDLVGDYLPPVLVVILLQLPDAGMVLGSQQFVPLTHLLHEVSRTQIWPLSLVRGEERLDKPNSE